MLRANSDYAPLADAVVPLAPARMAASLYTVLPNLPRPTADAKSPFVVAAALPELRAPDLNNSLIHLYRGELGRQIAYRQRLDTSTQYAVTIASTLTVLAFAYSSVPSYEHLLIAFFVCIFLFLEARRYLYYQVVRHRVRQLETGYYGRYILGPRWTPAAAPAPKVTPPPPPAAPEPALPPHNGEAGSLAALLDAALPNSSSTAAPPPTTDHPHSPSPSSSPPGSRRSQSVTVAIPDVDDNPNLWLPVLLESILHPSITMSLFQAVNIRMQRVYWGLLAGVYIGYVMKVLYVDKWVEQKVPVALCGGVVLLMFVWVYFVFPYTRGMKRFQHFYWTNERYHTTEDEADV